MNAAPDRIKLAIAAVLLTGFSLAFGDSIAKFISSDISVWQLFFLRSLLGTVAFVLLLRFAFSGVSFIPKSIFWVACRSLAMAIVWLLFYIALVRVHQALVSALLFTFPLFILLFSPLFGGDRVQGKTWFIVALALSGMLLIVRPEPGSFNPFALLALVSAVFFAAAMLITRHKLAQENSQVVAFAQNIGVLVIGGIGCLAIQLWQPEYAAENHFYFAGWVSLTALQWGIISVLAAAFMIGIIMGVIAYQNAPTPLIATFDYFYLLSALFWGWVVLSEVPNYLDLAGIITIAIAGILIVRMPAKQSK